MTRPNRSTVTGLIHSLRTNLDVKRNAAGLVDAISAEDIGKFPDADIAAAMQRIPGVTVSRGLSSLGGVPTSTGIATQITVRGFGPQFNETLFNSRKISSGVGPRPFDFSSIGADFVSEIDVLKSPDATLSSGAIGATVNIKFPRPLDHPGLELVASASGTISPEEGNVTPNVDALFSDTFAHDTFGILVDGAYADQPHARQSCQHPGLGRHPDQRRRNWPARRPAPPTANSVNAWFIQDYGLYQETTQDTRINGRAGAAMAAGRESADHAGRQLFARHAACPPIWLQRLVQCRQPAQCRAERQRHHHQLRPAQYARPTSSRRSTVRCCRTTTPA